MRRMKVRSHVTTSKPDHLVLLFNVWIGVAALPFILGALGIVGGVVAVVMAFRMRSAGV